MHLCKIAEMKSNLKKSEIVHISRPEVIFAKIFHVTLEMLNTDNMCKNHYKHFTYKRDI